MINLLFLHTKRWVFVGSLAAMLLGCAQDDPKAAQIRKELQTPKSADASAKRTINWKQSIDSKAFGLAPNPNVDGKTLAEIVASMSPGRDDGQLCSACHHQGEDAGGYGLPVAKNAASSNFDPNAVVGTTKKATWRGNDGWAKKFIDNKTKPDNIKALMQAWIDGGCK
jgi:hypothetical protein